MGIVRTFQTLPFSAMNGTLAHRGKVRTLVTTYVPILCIMGFVYRPVSAASPISLDMFYPLLPAAAVLVSFSQWIC